MLVNKTDSNSLANTIPRCGISTHNYSVDFMKKAAFVDELNNVMIHYENSVAKEIIVEYLKIRVEDINNRYK